MLETVPYDVKDYHLILETVPYDLRDSILETARRFIVEMLIQFSMDQKLYPP